MKKETKLNDISSVEGSVLIPERQPQRPVAALAGSVVSDVAGVEVGEREIIAGERMNIAQDLSRIAASIETGDLPEVTLLLRFAATARKKEARSMGLSVEESQRREELRATVMKLNFKDSPETFGAVRANLTSWISTHPDDIRIAELYKMIDTTEKTAQLYQTL